MPVLLGLVSALTYGASDFLAGLASRRTEVLVVTAGASVVALLMALIALALFPGDGPGGHAIAWGAAAGVGTASGTFALYRGFAVGRISVVATVSGLLTAVIPVIVGIAEGNSLSPLAAIGIAVAVPAIALVSWAPSADEDTGPSGAVWGALAGLGFALLLVALARAGTADGAWPLVAAETISVILTAPLALVFWNRKRTPVPRDGALLTVAAGALGGLAQIAFFAATNEGELAIVAVLTALYPGSTVVLARIVLGERWSRTQAVGLLTALAATLLVSVGN